MTERRCTCDEVTAPPCPACMTYEYGGTEDLPLPNRVEQSRQLAKKILQAFKARKGFSWWWDGILESAQQNIVAELEALINTHGPR